MFMAPVEHAYVLSGFRHRYLLTTPTAFDVNCEDEVNGDNKIPIVVAKSLFCRV